MGVNVTSDSWVSDPLVMTLGIDVITGSTPEYDDIWFPLASRNDTTKELEG